MPLRLARGDGVAERRRGAMATIKDAASEFLAHKRVAVTGVSRDPGSHGSNVVYKRLRERGYDVFAVNPNAGEVEGDRSYHDLTSSPGGVEAVVIGTRPEIADETMRECAELGIKHVWMHRGPGAGSVSDTATKYGRQHAREEATTRSRPVSRPPTPWSTASPITHGAEHGTSRICLLPGWGEQLPVPLGDDVDGAVDHLDGGLIVNRVRRYWYPGGPSFDVGQRGVRHVLALEVRTSRASAS